MTREKMPDLELEADEVEFIPLQVTSGILLHIGAGIYNSVAGAIKELVSNAYDAEASRIIISTGYPDFDRITISDNGTGMTAETLAKAMRSIGSSLKRELNPAGITLNYERPVIGHLGIGLMALSQVCEVATIESQVEGADTRFVAKLDFRTIRQKGEDQFLAATLEILQEDKEVLERNKDKLDLAGKAELSVGKDASKIVRRRKLKLPKGEHLGYCLIYRLPSRPGGTGTTITLHPLDPGVISTFNEINRNLDALPKKYIPEEYKVSTPDGQEIPKSRNPEEEALLWQQRRDRINSYSWRELCDRLRSGQLSYAVLPQYHQFLWQLAMMSPITYFRDGPVTVEPVLIDKRQQLEQFDFSLVVDNRELFKPVLLPSGRIVRIAPKNLRSDLDYFIDRIDESIKVGSDKELRVKGYIFWQRTQVTPSTLRGIEIYIRNVGIGLYDYSLMNFSTVNPTSRAGQLSGEIYVESGLEAALNVDRNSFRETDIEYLALQDFIWEKLGSTSLKDGLLGKSVGSYLKRKKLKDKASESKHLDGLREIVNLVAKGTVDVEFSQTQGEPWHSEVGKRKLIVHLNSNDWPRNAIKRQRAQRILIPIKVALMLGATPDDLITQLEELLF